MCALMRIKPVVFVPVLPQFLSKSDYVIVLIAICTHEVGLLVIDSLILNTSYLNHYIVLISEV